jgi:lysozyme
VAGLDAGPPADEGGPTQTQAALTLAAMSSSAFGWQLEAQQAQNQMSLSSKGLDFIKKYEKLSLTSYKDQAGYETIGYGHKILPGEDFSKGITKAQALDLLSHDAQGAVNAVNGALKVSVKQNQFDALVSLAFNAGPVSVKSSNQMMRAVNAGNVTEENFTAYRFVHVNGQAVVSQGLLRRREDEYSMYSEGKY